MTKSSKKEKLKENLNLTLKENQKLKSMLLTAKDALDEQRELRNKLATIRKIVNSET
jgi:hypothetical protein